MTLKSRPSCAISEGEAPADIFYSISHGERATSFAARSGPIILVTGASVTFGQGIRDEDTWPWLLQEYLPDYHVVNVAAMAYGTDQALLIADRRASQFAGTVRAVVLGFDDSQIDRNRSPERWLAGLYPFGKPLFVRKGAEVEYQGLVKLWSLGSTLDGILDHSSLMSQVADLSFDQIRRVEGHDGGRRLTVALITHFARQFESRGIKLVVIVVPYLWDYLPQSQEDRTSVVNQLNVAGIPTLVMEIPRLANGRVDRRQFMVGTHPNRQFNAMLANQLTQFLFGQAELGIKPIARPQ